MKLFGFLVLLLGLVSFRRAEDPVNFEYWVKKISANLYEVRIKATIERPWHIYSQFTPKEGPSLPTHISFSRNPLVELVGRPEEMGDLKTKYERILDVKLKYYTEQVEFVQRIRLKAAVNTSLNGAIDYMVCNDERCLPPTTEKFMVELKK